MVPQKTADSLRVVSIRVEEENTPGFER